VKNFIDSTYRVELTLCKLLICWQFC